jgi:hypothetical protein
MKEPFFEFLLCYFNGLTPYMNECLLKPHSNSVSRAWNGVFLRLPCPGIFPGQRASTKRTTYDRPVIARFMRAIHLLTGNGLDDLDLPCGGAVDHSVKPGGDKRMQKPSLLTLPHTGPSLSPRMLSMLRMTGRGLG